MPLYMVQDNERPLYVVGKDYGQAEYIWRKIIAKENDLKIDEVESPNGISFICEDTDLVLNGDNWESYCLTS